MKVRIEVDEEITEDEVVLRCRNLTDEIVRMQKLITGEAVKAQSITVYRDNTDYFLPLDKILFFETEGNDINVHTADDIYKMKSRLYELEEMLPGHFMRVSKSTILNIRCIRGINRNLSSSSIVELWGTHKQVYVSRYYYKPLRDRLIGKI